jgi:hypothetical protein
MIDPLDIDDAVAFVDPIDDSVLTDTGAVATGQLPSQCVPNALRVGNESTEAEFDDCTNDTR